MVWPRGTSYGGGTERTGTVTWGRRSYLLLLLLTVLSMLYHQNLVRHNVFEEENRLGEVWKWDLHLVHLLEVCRVLSPIVKTVLILDVCRSNDYSTNLVYSPWKALLLSYVVVGNGKKFTTDQPTLTRAPAGFDSVR